jgi:hypothetical protein
MARAEDASSPKHASSLGTSRWCNNVVKDVLGNLAWDKRKKRIYLPSLDEFMARVSGRYALQDSRASVEARATAVINVLKELQVPPNRELDPCSLNSQLQLADWLLYEENGDMPCGQWEHGSTYGALNILATSSALWEAIAGRLLKALAKDRSEDVIGRTSHVLRSAPESAKRLLLNDRAVRKKWKFPNPEALATEPFRRHLRNFAEIGYCMALHGDAEAIGFMNQAAAIPHVVHDLARWNSLHSKRNPSELMGSLQRKVEAPTENEKPIVPWHKAILEATESVFRQLDLL